MRETESPLTKAPHYEKRDRHQHDQSAVASIENGTAQLIEAAAAHARGALRARRAAAGEGRRPRYWFGRRAMWATKSSCWRCHPDLNWGLVVPLHAAPPREYKGVSKGVWKGLEVEASADLAGEPDGPLGDSSLRLRSGRSSSRRGRSRPPGAGSHAGHAPSRSDVTAHRLSRSSSARSRATSCSASSRRRTSASRSRSASSRRRAPMRDRSALLPREVPEQRGQRADLGPEVEIPSGIAKVQRLVDELLS